MEQGGPCGNEKGDACLTITDWQITIQITLMLSQQTTLDLPSISPRVMLYLTKGLLSVPALCEDLEDRSDSACMKRV